MNGNKKYFVSNYDHVFKNEPKKKTNMLLNNLINSIDVFSRKSTEHHQVRTNCAQKYIFVAYEMNIVAE